MGCCGKMIDKAGNIVKGWTNYLLGRDMVYTRAALYACKQCKHNRFLGFRGVCAICRCWIPAKTRVPLKPRTIKAEDGSMVTISERVENCKLGKWPPLPAQALDLPDQTEKEGD